MKTSWTMAREKADRQALDIDYLNGWLYGAVQGMNRIIKQDKGGPQC